jgi:hypothetical protein
MDGKAIYLNGLGVREWIAPLYNTAILVSQQERNKIVYMLSVL